MWSEHARQIQQNDVWSQWLLHRDGGSDAYRAQLYEHLAEIRDRVLDRADLRCNMTLLDMGSGDGLMAFGAIDRVGPSLKVICTDISEPMLQYAKLVARDRGVERQCSFRRCPADDQFEVWDQSVDAVVTRAVLAFVSDKPAAFAEMFRVLRPGGSLSIAEPIHQDEALQTIARSKPSAALTADPQTQIADLLRRLRIARFPATLEEVAKNPLTNFTERDLVDMALHAGFVDVHMELHIDVRPLLVRDWNVYLSISPHPWAEPTGRVLDTHFSPPERRLLESVLRPRVEAGTMTVMDTFAYLSARRPAGV